MKVYFKLTAIALGAFLLVSTQANAKMVFEGCMDDMIISNCKKRCTAGTYMGYKVILKDPSCKNETTKTDGCYCEYKD